MHILHVLNHTYRLNGHVHAAVDLACAQARLGHSVTVCSGGGSFDAVLAANGVELLVITQDRRPATAAKAAYLLYRAIRGRRVDLVHAHMVTSALLAWPACKLLGVPLVTTVHNEFQKSAVLMGIGNRVIAVSTTVRQSMERRGISSSRLRVVLNGTIGAARFDLMERKSEPLASPSIVFVGGLHPRKGVSDLIEAFVTVIRTHPNAHLTIVGEGPFAAEYQALVASMRCGDAVTFAGAQDNPRSYLLGADIFVLASHADPAPLVISEAREAGCAIVATEVDGIPELLEQGRAGILVPKSNPESLAAAISSLIGNPEMLALWRRNSQINIDYLSISRVTQETLCVYESIVRRSEPSK